MANSIFTVSATGGFIDPAGNAWSMRGLNATPQDCVIWSNPDTVLAQYPGLTCIRLNCNTGSDTDADIDAAVKAYTARGVVVMIEDHGGNQANLAWYTKMATLYKSNPYVFLETPNEPQAAAAQTAQNQIAVINAIKATGFANPIGLQPVGGYDGSNFPAVIQAIGTNQIFATPHIYYYQNDPNYAAAKVADWIANDKALGLFTSVDEFGNDAGDGYSLAPQGNTVVTAVIAANEAGKAGAVFWAMGNGHHPNGVDSAFLTADGTQLTPEGVLLQPWLSQATSFSAQPASIAPQPPVTPPAPASDTTGSGSDTLVLGISEDAWQGNAQFTVSVDGKQLGGTFTATALHAAGASQSFSFLGDWAPGTHAVVVNFLNDAWGGSSANDRNLYVSGITYDGAVTGQSAVFAGTGPRSFSVTDTTAIPSAPAPVTTGSGSDTLVLGISEDAWQGDAQFTVSVDGKQQGGTFTATASHASGLGQSFSFLGDWAAGAHTVVVNFVNDVYGGSAGADRNLYVNSISYDGVATGQSAVLGVNGPHSFSVTDTTAIPAAAPVAPITPPTLPPITLPTLPSLPSLPPLPVITGSGSDVLVIGISEDAWQGDAQFTVSVDGKQQGGTFTATASHASGFSQSFIFIGDWAAGAHAVTVNYLNDLYGGTAAADRNLRVDSITYDGTATGQGAVLGVNGPRSFSVTEIAATPGATPIPTTPVAASAATPAPSTATAGAGSDTLVLSVSEDAWQGDAQFTVSVDGRQLGGTFTATASHASGAAQNFTFEGDFGTGQHAVAVNFLNDAYGGSAAADRNLYVNGITYNGAATGQSRVLGLTGPAAFTVTGGTTPAVSETGDHGSLAKTFAQTGTYTVGGDSFVLTAGNAAAVTLGIGTSQIKFLGDSAVTLTGGSGSATVVADAGTNKFTAGAGTLDVTGGGGKDSYVFHAGNGLLKLEDFSAAKGDTLTVDKALQGAMTQTADGQGGVMLSFGADATRGVDIHGLAVMPAANILWG